MFAALKHHFQSGFGDRGRRFSFGLVDDDRRIVIFSNKSREVLFDELFSERGSGCSFGLVWVLGVLFGGEWCFVLKVLVDIGHDVV